MEARSKVRGYPAKACRVSVVASHARMRLITAPPSILSSDRARRSDIDLYVEHYVVYLA